MTEAVKQWIEKETESARSQNGYPPDNLIGMRMGLTKGIEIAQGFAEWIDDYYFIERTKKWMLVDDNFYETTTESKLFTTSQLLEKYIEQLGK